MSPDSLRSLARLVIPALLALPACAGEPGTGETSMARDSAGIEITESTGPRWHEGVAWSIEADPLLDIGVVDGPLHYQLSRVSGATRLPDGRIVVADEGSSQIRMYDRQGRHVWSVGRAGEGPGEFRSIKGLAISNDSVLVLDAVLGRVSVFDLEGSLSRTIPLESTSDPIHPLRMYSLAGTLGDTAFVLVPHSYPANRTPTTGVVRDTVPNLVYDREGMLKDTIGEFSGMDLDASPESAGLLLFGRISSADTHDGRLYITDGGCFEVRVYEASGLERLMRTSSLPDLVTDPDLRTLEAAMISRVPDGQASRAIIRNRIAEKRKSERKPAISKVVVDDLGYVWAGGYRPSWASGNASRQWLVFDPEGRLLGPMQLPGTFTPFQIGRDVVLGTWRDELDVEHLRLYALQRR